MICKQKRRQERILSAAIFETVAVSAAKGRYILFIAGIPLIFDAISYQMQMSVWRSNNKNDANWVEHYFLSRIEFSRLS